MDGWINLYLVIRLRVISSAVIKESPEHYIKLKL